MNLYRVVYEHEGGTSTGYGWFATRRAADKAVAVFLSTTKDEDGSAKVEVIYAPPLRKRSLIDLLNQYASYPDNG